MRRSGRPGSRPPVTGGWKVRPSRFQRAVFSGFRPGDRRFRPHALGCCCGTSQRFAAWSHQSAAHRPLLPRLHRAARAHGVPTLLRQTLPLAAYAFRLHGPPHRSHGSSRRPSPTFPPRHRAALCLNEKLCLNQLNQFREPFRRRQFDRRVAKSGQCRPNRSTNNGGGTGR